MSVGAPVAADVPLLFDVIINGQGYILLRTVDQNLPFRTQRAKYTSTPTFLERQNVTGAYSDNQQDFFLTSSQNDWSGGEDQRYFKSQDPQSKTQYWKGMAVDITIPGQVSMLPATKTIAAPSGGWAYQTAFIQFPRLGTTYLVMAGTTNLFELDDSGVLTDKGAHGATNANNLGTDGQYLYLSSGSVGAGRIDRFDNSYFKTAFATGLPGLPWYFAYLNKILYSIDLDGGTNNSEALASYDVAGTRTLLYSWQNAVGGQYTQGVANTFHSYGGKLFITRAPTATPYGGELYIYDGTAPVTVGQLPPNFRSAIQGTINNYQFTIVNGIVFIAGLLLRPGGTGKTAIFYYVNGQLDMLWASASWSPLSTFTYAQICPYPGGVAFTDAIDGTVRFYNLGTGAVSTLFAMPYPTPFFNLTAGVTSLVIGSHLLSDPATFFPDTVAATTATVTSSIMDFDNTLTKQFRGVKVDWIPATDGNGGSVDISYQVDSVDGAYTSLQTSALSGTEYLFGNVSGRGVSVRITLNKGTSTLGPILKRVYVRAAPVLQSYRQCEYIIDCTGAGGKTPVILNDQETAHPLSGLKMAQNLNVAIGATTPITISDQFGTYSGQIEPGLTEMLEIAPQEFIARIATRQI